MKSVFNKDKNLDATKQSMFFGPDLAVQRYDTMKYPIFDKLTQQQLGYFWRPEEVSLQKDRNDYNELTAEQKFIFTSNLKYQTMLDSVQGRGPALAFLPLCSLPELESCLIAWDFMETIHSRSYTYIIKNLYSNPAEVFDTITEDEKIQNRAKSVTEKYDELIELGYKYKLNPDKVDEYELKKKLYLALITVNILEGLRFYVSFACSFAFGELKKLEGSAKIISFIARDESQHLAMSQRIINNWKDFEKDKEDSLIPILAEEVPTVANGGISPDGMTYTFKIRQGVTFHDGSELTADDVVFSINRMIIMDLAAGPSWMYTEVLNNTDEDGDGIADSIVKINQYTVQFTLKEPAPRFLPTNPTIDPSSCPFVSER